MLLPFVLFDIIDKATCDFLPQSKKRQKSLCACARALRDNSLLWQLLPIC